MNKTTKIISAQGIGAAQMPVSQVEPVKFLKRVGSTMFEINTYFSRTSKETLEDKILGLIEREVANNA
jgi:hypothetical protein